ncbi:MAG: hypothetical protein AAGH68_02280 [Pseudomonadota bacterium]
MTQDNLIDYEALKARMDRARKRRMAQAQAQKLRRIASSALKAAAVPRVEASYDGY